MKQVREPLLGKGLVFPQGPDISVADVENRNAFLFLAGKSVPVHTASLLFANPKRPAVAGMPYTMSSMPIRGRLAKQLT
ncbi:MAG TPA: hypothetical protein VD995_32130 [Azospirillum sp.]|nr:hypothetical protein [Azospirillum sp.]